MTGIVIEVHAEKDFRVKDRLAAEAFQIIAEALSNVRRHTKSTQISVRIERQYNCFVMEIENNNPEAAPAMRDFTPKSIAARAEALGGLTRITVLQSRTIVGVEIPL
jgi:signal transduction histidine kinase